jgi:hypothetical protein
MNAPEFPEYFSFPVDHRQKRDQRIFPQGISVVSGIIPFGLPEAERF